MTCQILNFDNIVRIFDGHFFGLSPNFPAVPATTVASEKSVSLERLRKEVWPGLQRRKMAVKVNT
jgi:hypothetical protein